MLGTIFDLEPSGKKCPIVILEAYWHDVRESGGIVFLKVVFYDNGSECSAVCMICRGQKLS
ncbi:hypothetical protein M3231_02615 [Neobacillus mesonae]|nr:hypothetical protein [Neobacillus mesonae]